MVHLKDRLWVDSMVDPLDEMMVHLQVDLMAYMMAAMTVESMVCT